MSRKVKVSRYKLLLIVSLVITAIGSSALISSQLIHPLVSGSDSIDLVGTPGIGNASTNVSLHIYPGDSMRILMVLPTGSTVRYAIYEKPASGFRQGWKLVADGFYDRSGTIYLSSSSSRIYCFDYEFYSHNYNSAPSATIYINGPLPTSFDIPLMIGGAIAMITASAATAYYLTKYSREYAVVKDRIAEGKVNELNFRYGLWWPPMRSSLITALAGFVLLAFGGMVTSFTGVGLLFPVLLMLGVGLFLFGFLSLVLKKFLE